MELAVERVVVAVNRDHREAEFFDAALKPLAVNAGDTERLAVSVFDAPSLIGVVIVVARLVNRLEGTMQRRPFFQLSLKLGSRSMDSLRALYVWRPYSTSRRHGGSKPKCPGSADRSPLTRRMNGARPVGYSSGASSLEKSRCTPKNRSSSSPLVTGM